MLLESSLGLLFVGIDIIGDFLTEINVTSPTGIREINPMMNVRIEKLITDAVESLMNQQSYELNKV